MAKELTGNQLARVHELLIEAVESAEEDLTPAEVFNNRLTDEDVAALTEQLEQDRETLAAVQTLLKGSIEVLA